MRLKSFSAASMAEAMKQVRQALGDNPVLLTSPAVRPYVRSVIERFRPQTPVLSQSEIHPKARLKTVATI